jgi:tetratricopeptide (TPR) repeat protein
MKGRILVWPLALALLAGLIAQTDRWRDRMTASSALRQVELLTMATLQTGRVPRGLMPANLETLRRAEALDPLEVGIPIARGSQHLLMRNHRAAIEAYEEAARLEPRPEIDLNLGRVLLDAGRTEEARVHFQRAARLSPHLAPLIPAQMR